MLGLNYLQILIISFLFLTAINCLITYLCSTSSLKVFQKTKSYTKGINKIKIYDTFILTTLTLVTSGIYVVLSYFYFVSIFEISDYFLTLSICLGFVLSLITTFFSRLCYCYACNVLLKTKYKEYECFIENFFYLLRIFFPIFLISFVITTINILPISIFYRQISGTIFICLYLLIWLFSTPFKTIFSLNARKIKDKKLINDLSYLFSKHEIKRYKLYYWDSSISNDANAMAIGFFKHYLFISTSLIEMLDEEELKAVVLHEIGHIKHHHFIKILISKIALLIFMSAVVYFTLITKMIDIWLLFVGIFIFVISMGVNLKGSKGYEDDADLFVNKEGYGEQLISALKKISYQDSVTNQLDEFFSSHPNVNSRIKKLKKK